MTEPMIAPVPDLVFLTKHYPEANGREPQPGEVAYHLWFPLENGRILGLYIGQKDFDDLKKVVEHFSKEEGR